MKKLFEPLELNSLKTANRTVRSATWEGLADAQGFVRPELTELQARLARFDVGLVIPGYLYVRSDGRGLPWQTGACSDAHVDGLRKLADAVHANHGSAVAQIAHAGARTRPETIGGAIPVAPSCVEGSAFGQTPRQLATSEIQTLVTDFASAALRVRTAGFDGVQLHAAHGYLISQFLSPFFNRRTDAYGGTPERRRRFLMEIYEAVRHAVGTDYPVLIKINATDGIQGGITPDQSLTAVRELAKKGLAAVEVSGGMAGSDRNRPSRKGIHKPSQEAYFREHARAFKKELNIPVILVGGIKSPEIAEDILACGDADAVSMSRALICEPDLVNRWKQGDRSRAACISCNKCLAEGLKGTGIACVGLSETRENRGTSFE